MRHIIAIAAIFMALVLGQSGWAATAESGPRVIIQSMGNGGIEVAAWSPDDRYLVLASSVDRAVMVVEVSSGHVIDRRNIPTDLSPDGLDYLYFTGADFATDGLRVRLHGLAGEFMVDGPATSREIEYDLKTHAFRLLPAAPVPPGAMGLVGFQQRVSDFEAFHGAGHMDAEARLPKLPASHSGKIVLTRETDGLTLAEEGKDDRLILEERAASFASAAMNADGRRLVLLDGDALKRDYSKPPEAIVRLFNIATGSFQPKHKYEGEYGKIVWLDDQRLLLTQGSDDTDRVEDLYSDKGEITEGLVINSDSGKIMERIPGRCFITPIKGGDFIGAGPGNCRAGKKLDRTVQRYDSKLKQWLPFAVEDLKGRFVNGLTASPDGSMVALIAEAKDGSSELLYFTVDGGNVFYHLQFNGPNAHVTGPPAIAEDNMRLYIPENGRASELYGAGYPPKIDLVTSAPEMMVAERGMLLASSAADTRIERADIATRKALPPLEFGNVSAGGFVRGKPIFWALSYLNGLRLWDTRTWQPILTTYLFPQTDLDNAYVSVRPDGRYDTNIGPDNTLFRWAVDDAPLTSYAPQTFMRDYFTPRLGQKVFDCMGAGDCGTVLPPLTSFAQLNRTTPRVTIVSALPVEGGRSAEVTVEVNEGNDPLAPAGRNRSGAYDLRLFLDDRLIAQLPDVRERENGTNLEALADQINSDVRVWRQATDVHLVNGKVRYTFHVAVPTWPGNGFGDYAFSAYAFNSDRVKGETATLRYNPPRNVQRRPRRAYLVTIGISDYDEPRLKLGYAGSDAELLAGGLAKLDDYEVRQIRLTSRTPAGKPMQVPADTIAKVLGGLAFGLQGPEDEDAFRAMGVNPAMLVDPITPDDVLILSFSGHGWADSSGKFALLGSDASWPSGTPRPAEKGMLSSAYLKFLLDLLPAGEIAIIIDACHSGASVATANFKPGPMGDASLGQLAFDKKLRIIAATQGDDIALETSQLGHGLLTWTLAKEGLDPANKAVDVDSNGWVTLDEWFRFAELRLPALSQEIKARASEEAAGEDTGLVFVNRAKPAFKPQLPALFDFNRKPSGVMIRRH